MYSKLKNLSLNGIINKDEEILLNTTKIKNKENKNINLSISNFEKNNIIFNLFEKIDKNKYTTITNESFYDDLNIFDKDKNSVFNILNKTETLFGEIELRKERSKIAGKKAKKSPAKHIGLVPGVGVTAKAVKRKKVANKTSPVKHDKDDWGFEHGHKFHRKDAKSDSPDYGQWDVKDHPDRKPRK